MAHIQMTDGNSSDSGLTEELTNEELTDEELTDEELSAIDGGGVGALASGVGSIATSIHGDISNGRPINWSSAAGAGWGGVIGGGITGGIAGAFGGPWGIVPSASLAGED
jgi:hypothetical protein